MRTIDFLIALASHAFAFLPFWSSVRKGKLPNTAHFATLSIMLYYDLGLVLEVLGYPYRSAYFSSLFGARDDTYLVAMILLAVAPWLFHAGSLLVNPRGALQPQEPNSSLVPSSRWPFYLLASSVAVLLASYGGLQLLQHDAIWLARLRLGETWGPLIIVLYLPLHFLAFYVRQTDAHTRWGLAFALGLALATVVSTAAIGQRTIILLPFLILVIFRFKMTLGKLPIVAAALLLIASTLLTLFKYQYAQAELQTTDLIADTISNDIARGPVLRTTIELSDPLGARLLPYPFAGYAYSLLFFVPRQLAPYKGGPTAQYFTSYMSGDYFEDTNWALGIGVIEELILNGGVLLVIPGLLLYGVAMGLLDKVSWRVPSLVVPTRLAAIWLCGYNLPALLMLFGVMALVGASLHHLFVHNQVVRTVQPGFEGLKVDKLEGSNLSTFKPSSLQTQKE
jgi:hypothetical protein